MALDSYSGLKTAIADWLNRNDLDAIDDFIDLAETRIYRDLRIRAMETALSGTISSGTLALPTGYMGLKHAYIDRDPVQWLDAKDAQFIYRNYPTRAADGTPGFIAEDGGVFIFGPYPDTGYSVKGVYYKRLDGLSGSNPTNWLTTDAPDLILFGALCEAEPYVGADERMPMWQSRFFDAMERVKLEEERDLHPLHMSLAASTA